MTENDLIAGCIKNERKAQRALYDRFASKLYAVAMRYTKNREDAQDVVQDAFIKIYKNIGQFRGECPLDAWLRRIVVNTALKQLKNNPAKWETDDVETYGESFEAQNITPIQQISHEYLLGLVQKLPSGCQAVFNMFAIEGYGHQEIAQILEISEGTSKSQYSRARQLLQKMLGNEFKIEKAIA